MFWKKKEKRVCRDCGFISRNFPKRKVTMSGGTLAWNETQRQCPECGGKNIKTFDYILERMVEKEYGGDQKNRTEQHRSILFDGLFEEEEPDFSEIFKDHPEQKVRLYDLLDNYNPETIVDGIEKFLEENAEPQKDKELKSALKELGYSPGTVKRIMDGEIDG